MRKKKNGEERIGRCAAYLCADPAENKGRWLDIYTKDYTESLFSDGESGDGGKSAGESGKFSSLRLEIGCGKGGFITETARREPDVLFIAVERVRDVLMMAMERAKAEKTKNVIFLSEDAARLEDFFAPGELSVIYLNFSDPWPKARHAKRRLSAPGFLGLYKKVLSPDGEVRMKTDNDALFEYSLESFESCGCDVFYKTRDLHAQPEAKDNVMTEYEANFSSKGKNINMLRARFLPESNQEENR